jgi:hypothetical protein
MGNGAISIPFVPNSLHNFVPNEIKGQGLEVMHVASALNLSRYQLNKLYQKFCKTDVFKSTNIATREFIVCHSLRPDWVADVLFKDMESFSNVTFQNTLNFCEYLIVVWNFCTANRAIFARMIFNFFHKLDMGHVNARGQEVLVREEVDAMIDTVFGKNHEKQFHGALSMQHDNIQHHRDYGDITVDELIGIAIRSPALILPIIEAQVYVRSILLGSSQWRKLAKFREKKYGDVAIQNVLPDSFMKNTKAGSSSTNSNNNNLVANDESSGTGTEKAKEPAEWNLNLNLSSLAHTIAGAVANGAHGANANATHDHSVASTDTYFTSHANNAGSNVNSTHHSYHHTGNTTAREVRRRSAGFMEAINSKKHVNAAGGEGSVPNSARRHSDDENIPATGKNHDGKNHDGLSKAAERIHQEHKRRKSLDALPTAAAIAGGGPPGATVVSHDKTDDHPKPNRRPSSAQHHHRPAADANAPATAHTNAHPKQHHTDLTLAFGSASAPELIPASALVPTSRRPSADMTATHPAPDTTKDDHAHHPKTDKQSPPLEESEKDNNHHRHHHRHHASNHPDGEQQQDHGDKIKGKDKEKDKDHPHHHHRPHEGRPSQADIETEILSHAPEHHRAYHPMVPIGVPASMKVASIQRNTTSDTAGTDEEGNINTTTSTATSTSTATAAATLATLNTDVCRSPARDALSNVSPESQTGRNSSRARLPPLGASSTNNKKVVSPAGSPAPLFTSVDTNVTAITSMLSEADSTYNPNSMADYITHRLDPIAAATSAVKTGEIHASTYSAPTRIRDETTNARKHVDLLHSASPGIEPGSTEYAAAVLNSNAVRGDSKQYGGTAELLKSDTYVVRRRPSLDAIPSSEKTSTKHHHHHHGRHHHKESSDGANNTTALPVIAATST